MPGFLREIIAITVKIIRFVILSLVTMLGLSLSLMWTVVCAFIGAFVGFTIAGIVELILGINRSIILEDVIIIGGIVLGGFVGFNKIFSKSEAPDLGSAKFADMQELNSLSVKTESSLAIGCLPLKSGKTPLIYYSGPGHLLTIAPTRSGKGVGAIIPNLLLADRSVFVIDPKGENAKITAKRRRAFGKTFVIDPFGISGEPSAAFNPLTVLLPDNLDLAEEAAVLADALVLNTDRNQEAHWDEEAKALLSGLIMYVVATESEANKTLDRVRQHLTLSPAPFRALLIAMSESRDVNGLIARTGGRFLGKDERELSGVLSTAQRHTQFLDSPRITNVLSHSDFTFAELASGVVSVFLVLPPDRLETYNRWLRLMINAALRDLACLQTKPARSILFLLDEFASLGPLAEVRRAMGLMAGYGVQLWPILQDLSQLRALYDKSAETFIANAAVLQAFNVRDFETARLLSNMLGETTISYTTTSESSGTSGGIFDSTPSKSTGISEHFQARSLMKPEEILNFPDHLELLFVQGMPPAVAGKIYYYSHPEFSGLYE